MQTFLNKLLIVGIAATLSTQAWGSGFQMRYQSAESMGTGFASAGSDGNSISHIYYNPGIFLKGEAKSKFAFEGTLIFPLSSEFEATNGMTGDGAKNSFFPGFFYGQKFGEDMALTVSLTTPWASSSDYGTSWVGRYKAVETLLGSFNLTPAFSKKINDKVILSVGPQIQYLFGTLTNNVDLGTIGAAMSVPGAAPFANDALSEFDGSGFGVGAVLGATFLLSDSMTLAVNYTSQITTTLDGDFEATTLTGGAVTDAIRAGALPNGDAETEITTPDMLSVSLSHRYSEKVASHLALSWSSWSVFDEIVIDRPGASTVLPQEWDDTFFVAAGATYKLKDNLTLRGGLSYETGAPDDLRTPRTVDTDRLGIALGSTLKAGRFDIDVAFTQIVFVGDLDVSLPPADSSPTAGLDGEFDATATLFRVGAQYTW